MRYWGALASFAPLQKCQHLSAVECHNLLISYCPLVDRLLSHDMRHGIAFNDLPCVSWQTF